MNRLEKNIVELFGSIKEVTIRCRFVTRAEHRLPRFYYERIDDLQKIYSHTHRINQECPATVSSLIRYLFQESPTNFIDAISNKTIPYF